ncbi:hypothetical protein VNO77_41648 [Canavalia gladiata]|uniref:Neutral/alkaline non-lysosomal ceramidase C-terminal domain-containing protein n=1 Tax=Canavalia gladiata TaxID=3824 RepID=A0AAN9PS64_CANGL
MVASPISRVNRVITVSEYATLLLPNFQLCCFVVHGPFIWKIINNVFYLFIFKAQRHTDVVEFLDILHIFKKLTQEMAKGKNITIKIPSPPDLSSVQINLLLGSFGDSPQEGNKFGDIKEDLAFSKRGYFMKGDTSRATFWSVNPRYDLLTEGTFAVVERLQGRRWISVYDDDDLSFQVSNYDNDGLHRLSSSAGYYINGARQMFGILLL